MREVSFTGGSRIGWVNATWPLARLTACARTLSLWSLGTYEFTPQQVVSLAPYGVVPLIGQGLRIHHNRPDYPEKMVFWCFGSPDSVIADIKGCGFIPQGRQAARAGGWPVRWIALLAVFVLWNALFYADQQLAAPRSHEPGGLALLDLALLFGGVTALRRSTVFQKLVLTPGHSIGEIKAALTLFQLVSGFLLLVFGVSWLSRWPW